MITRTTQSLLAAVGVLVVAFGVTEAHPPKVQPKATGQTVRTAVQQTELVCPPSQSGKAATQYSLAAPGAPTGVKTADGTAAASLGPLTGTAASSTGTSKGSTAQLQLKSVGTAATGSGKPAGALSADATGPLAPGFAAQQTTQVSSGVLGGASCTQTGTDFWFADAGIAKSDSDTLVLTNNEDTAADVDVQIFGTTGEIEGTQAAGIGIPAGTSKKLSVTGLVGAGSGQVASVHVQVRSGRVAAALFADTGANGADWLPAATTGSSAVIPGLPADVKHAVLAVTAPGSGTDADLKIQVSGQNGWFTPAGHESIHVKAGTMTTVDLGAVAHGQPGAIRLTPSDPTQAPPVVAGVQLVRGGGSSAESAFAAAGQPVTARATVPGNVSGSAGKTTLLLTDTSTQAATATVTVLGSSGTASSQQVRIPAGVTAAVTPKAPSGQTVWGVTVVPGTGGGQLYVARTITGSHGYTEQQYADDHSTVLVPRTADDPAILLP